MKQSKPSLCFLSQYFFPEPGATSELLSEIAFRLSEEGFAVEAIAGQPSYFGPTSCPSRLRHRGVSVRRVWCTGRNRKRVLWRAANSATFSASALVRLLASSSNSVLVAVTNPPLLPWVCWAVALLRRRSYVLVIHDVYPDIAVELGALREGSLLVRMWRVLNRWAYRRATRIVVLGRDMKDRLEDDVGGEGSKLRIIPNWADGISIRPKPSSKSAWLEELGLSGRFVVQYSGNVGRFHEVDTILRAARSKIPGTEFLFIGTGAQADQVSEAAGQLDCVRILPFQPRERLGQTLNACDASLVTLREGLSGLAVPSKLYGILAAGKPVIAIVPSTSEAAQVVRESHCGFVIPPGDWEELSRTVTRLRENPDLCKSLGARARRAFEERYDLAVVVGAWSDLLSHLSIHGSPAGESQRV